VLVTTKKTLFTLAIAAAVTLVGLRQPAFSQAAQPNWKDRAEFDLYDAITKEAQPAKRLDLLNQWKEKYPTSEFGNVRMQVFAQTYQQQGKCPEAVTAANELLAKDANNLTALNIVMTCIYTIPNPSADQLASAEKAATQTLGNLNTLFDTAKKPANVSDGDWNNAKSGIQLLAQNTLGFVAMNQKNYDKSEAEFTKSLQMNPNQGQISYWLASVILAEKNPAKQSLALWHFARAAAYDGPGAFPSRPQVQAYLDKAYVGYHGSKEGLDQVLVQAKASPFPPSPDWKVKSKVDLAQEDMAKEEEARKANPQLALWKSIKEALTGAEAQKYFEEHMKGAELPAFKGKLIEARPETNPKELVLSITDGTTPDATLKLDAALKGKMDPGAEIEFAGIASGYTASPFMVTFDVEKAKINGWKGVGGAAAPPAKKAAPAHRPVPKK